MKTVEVRKVPVIRLEDVLAAVPEDLDIEYLKTDVQGVDLQVIQSVRIPLIVSADSGDGEHRLRGRRSEATIVAGRPVRQVIGQAAVVE